MRWLTLVIALLTVGCGTPSLLITPVTSGDRLEETIVEPGRGWGGERIVVIPIEGMIMNTRPGGLPLSVSENPVAVLQQQLRRAADDTRVRAVVLRINSPGGTVTGSDTMYRLVRSFREKSGKPVVASLQEVAASGGYYVALAADEIWAGETSLVGSIGVIFQTFSVQGLMGKVGVKTEAIVSGPMKDLGSPLHDLTDAERGVIQSIVDENFARFRGLVSQRRSLGGPDEIAKVTDGRVFTGSVAKSNGLVDRLGTLEDAINRARELGGADSARVIMYRRPWGPGGSIYASTELPQPRADGSTVRLQLVPEQWLLPTGLYYLWRP